MVCTQTTLSVDDTAEIINAIKSKFSNVEFPKADDICYATQNRQDAVKELINKCDHILIIGSNNSSNTLRLVELVDKAGKAVNLISDPESFVPEESIENIEDSVIGTSSGASAPEKLIEQLISKLIGTSDYKTSELIQTLEVIEEKTHFPLPEPLNC